MTPAAILAAAIEVLDDQAARPGPLDLILGRYQRNRRYIGSKDRAALAERLFGMARRHARIGWRLAEAGAPDSPRARVIADLALTDALAPDAISALLDGAGHGPPPLDASEWSWLARLGPPPLESLAMPDGVRLECPEWALAGVRQALGEAAETELRALQQSAPLDLRVNTLKSTRDDALAAIRAAGFEASATPHSPMGVRLQGRVALGRLPGLLDGAVEPQDEGSQLAALALAPQPGERVADFCAGAGGKTLALAAMMENRGRLLALDSDARRLERSAPRLAKAGVDNVERRAIAEGRDPWLRRQSGKFDRVLIDAPCSGVGAWRRNPDARWSRGQPSLETLTGLQAAILDRAARLVRPGGLLVYVTCSILHDENLAQIERFLARNQAFALEAPEGFPILAPAGHVTLTPATTGTDGFFIAWLRKQE